MGNSIVRVAAVGDLHCSRSSHGVFQPLFAHVGEAADMLLLAGDLTDLGLPDEAHVLAQELTVLRIPIAAVLGNHDVESGKTEDIRQILTEAGVKLLDGAACEISGVGIAGIKGFGGGFGQRALSPWGEDTIKLFVREAVDEALKLERALARLRTQRLIALMHYAPIADTVDGEPAEIYPFLGSSRLEEPLGRYPVSLVVHAHAHRGRAEATTKGGVPVYNVSMPLLGRVFSNRQPFRIFELTVAGSALPALSAASTSPQVQSIP